MGKRINSIDIAKAWGIFLIVLGHVLKFGKLRKIIYAFNVPLFFFLSGLCFSRKDNGEFIKKKIKTIYIPYIIISLVSIIIYVFLGKYISKDINNSFFKNIFGMVYANSNLGNMEWNQPLWFLPCLMILLIIINFIENIISRNRFKQFIRGTIVIFSFIISMICSKFRIYLPLQLETALSMMMFTYVGIIFKESNLINKFLTIKHKNIFCLFIIAFSVMAVFMLLSNDIISVRQNKYGNYAIYLLVSCILIISTVFMSVRIDEKFKNLKIITYIGRNTLIILFFHKFPILFFQKICPVIKDILNGEENIVLIITSIVISILVIVACLIFDLMLKKVKRRVIEYDTN